MKYSNTAITQLNRWYKQILIKCAIFNAAVITGGMMMAAPAMAESYTPVDSRTVVGAEDVSFNNNSFTGLNTANYGGAIYSLNGAGSVTVSNSIFEGNSASGSGSYHQGGAIYINTNQAVVNSITNTIFDGNQTVGAASRGGAIYLNNNNSSTNIITTISDSTFTNNESIRTDQPLNIMGSAIYQGGGTLNLNNTTFGGDTIDDANVGTTIVVSNNGTINLSDNTFQNNISKKEGVLSFNGANARGNFEGENNFLNNDGHAVFVFSGWSPTDTSHDAGTLTFKNSSVTNFISNSALNDKDGRPDGGALYIGANGTATFEEGSEVNFTNNTAQKGGAVYNNATGVINFNGDATFSGNTDENGANDIYNMGTLNFGNANEISITGGIDGAAGVVNVNGAGGLKIDHAAVKNQTLNVASELHLDTATLTGSTLNLGSDAVLNTINNAIDNYSAIELADGANLRVDANLDLAQMDKFSAQYGHNTIDLNIVEANFIGDATSATAQLMNDGVKVNTSSVIYEWDDVNKTHTKTGIVGTGNADGKVNISNGVSVSSLEVAADDTDAGVKESVVYEMGENEDFGTATVENATFIVEGNDQTVNVSGTFGVDNQSVVTMNNVVFDGPGSIDTYGKLRINDSEVNVDLNIKAGAEFASDPTTFSGVVTNEATSTTFEDDTFKSSATLKNSGVASFTNTTFENGSNIDGNGSTGTLNFVSGTNRLGASVVDNNINLKNGSSIILTDAADIDGLALTTDANGGTLDMRNKKIDTLGSTVLGSDLNVLMDLDLNADKSDTLGTISGGYGLNLQALELLALGGATEDIQIASASTNVVLSSDVMDTLHTYYSTVSYNATTGVLSLSGKNPYASADLVGSWGSGNYIKAYDASDSANTSVGANLGYLDTQVKANEDEIASAQTAIGGINDDITVAAAGTYIAAGTDVGANLSALDTQVKANADAIAGKTLTVDTSTGVATIKDGATTAEVYTKAAAETIFAEKQAWTSKEFGYDTNSTDAKTILTAAGFTNQTTGDTDVGLIDAALQLKSEKQNTLTAGSGIDITSDVISVKDASLANFDASKVTDSTEVAALLANPTTASDANVMTEKAVVAGITTLLDQKQAWVSKEFGYDTDSTDAKTILTAAGFTNQTTGDSDVGLIDAALQLKSDKQDKLIAGQGIKIADDGKTISVKLADTTSSKSGLQLSDDGLSIKTGDTMQISNEGYLNLKYDANIFKTDSSAGLQIKDKGITNAMIADNAVTFDKLATSVYSTTVGAGSDTVLATTSAVKSYADSAISDAIKFNSDHTVTLTVGSNSADVYDKTGTENYVKANAQNADYTALTSGAVDLNSNSTIAQALQTLDSKKASLENDNTFTGANTFKSDSGIVIQNATTPAVQSNLVATQLTIGTDTHDVLQLTVSDSTTNGGALYVKDADIVTNKGFTALDDSGVDRFSADEDGIETKDDSGNTTFSVDSATGNTTVAGKMDIEGDTTIGDKFSVKAADGSITAAGGNFGVDGDGNIGTTGGLYVTKLAQLAGGINVNDKFIVNKDTGDTGVGHDLTVSNDTAIGHDLVVGNDATIGGNLKVGDYFSVTASDGSFSAADGNFTVDADGAASVAGGNFTVDADGAASVAGGNFTVDKNGNTTAQGNLGVYGTTYLQNTNVNGALAVTGTSWLKDAVVDGALAVSGDSTVGQNFAVAGTSYLHNTSVTGDMAVSGTTRTGALTFDGTSYVAAMDQGDAAITSGTVDDQAKRTMATNATVAKTVGNLDALKTAANGVTSANDVADAINSLGLNVETATGGTFAADGKWTGTVTGTKAVSYAQNVSYNDLVSSIDQLASNIGAATTAAKGNIASTNTVNANLDSLDVAIGDRSFATTKYIAPHDDLSTAVTKLDSELHTLNHDVRKLRHDMDRGLASVAALSALLPNARGTGNTSLSVGTGYYNGHSAFAFGGAHWFTDNLMVNVGAAASMGHTRDMTYRAGVSYSF